MSLYDRQDPFRNYDAWKTATPYDDEKEHYESCPQSPDTPETCADCGEEVDKCGWQCEEYHLVKNWLRGFGFIKKYEIEEVAEPGDCTCPTDAEIAADTAEAKADARRDRNL